MSNKEKINEMKTRLSSIDGWVELENNSEFYYFNDEESEIVYKNKEHAGFYLNDEKIDDESAANYYDEVIEKLS